MIQADLVVINGEVFTDPKQAKISVFDRGFLFGDAVYEVTRSYGRVLFQIEAHVARLYQSAESIQMNLDRSEEDTVRDLYRIAKLVNQDDKYFRVQVTRGTGPIGMSSDLAPHCNWVYYVKNIDKVTGEQYKQGVPIVITDRLRNSKRALDPNIKSGNYLNNVLAFQAAMPTRAFESIMVDARGNITEGTTSNIWIVKNGVAITPPKSSDLLIGITRRILFEIGASEGLSVIEGLLTPDDLRQADEVFITSSTREVLAVSTVDGQAIKSHGCGPMTQKLGELYKRYVAEYCEDALKTHPL